MTVMPLLTYHFVNIGIYDTHTHTHSLHVIFHNHTIGARQNHWEIESQVQKYEVQNTKTPENLLKKKNLRLKSLLEKLNTPTKLLKYKI